MGVSKKLRQAGAEDAGARVQAKAPLTELPEKPRRDLPAGELEFTDLKVRVGLMLSSLLINFVWWETTEGACLTELSSTY